MENPYRAPSADDAPVEWRPGRVRPWIWWMGAVILALASIYCLLGYVMQAWLTAAQPAAADIHRFWAYMFLGATFLTGASAVLCIVLGNRERRRRQARSSDGVTR